MKHIEVMNKISAINENATKKELEMRVKIKGAVSYVTGKPYCDLGQLSLNPGEYVTSAYIKKHNLTLKEGAQPAYLYNPIRGYFRIVNDKVNRVDKRNDNAPTEKEVKEFFINSYKETELYEVGYVNELERRHENLYHEDVLRLKKMNSKLTQGVNSKILEIVFKYLKKNKVSFHQQGLYGKSLGYVSYPNKKGQQNTANIEGIHVPNICHFTGDKAYFSVLFHESAHSTAEKLGREFKNDKKSVKYAIEECVAELTSMKLMHHFKINNKLSDNHSIRYINDYVCKISKNRDIILKDIEKKSNLAAKLILGGKLDNQDGVPSIEKIVEPIIKSTPDKKSCDTVNQ